MGGNALSFGTAARMTTDEMNGIFTLVSNDLKMGIQDLELMLVPSYSEKPTHGDIDILVSTKWEVLIETLKRWVENYSRVFGANMHYVEYHKNGPVVSIGLSVYGLGTVQLDFIKINPKLEINALAYYGYNDLGNLMGRVAAARGFKYGPEGLSYKAFARDNPSRLLAEIVVTTDVAMIFKYLGWDYYDWARIHSEGGFKNLEEVFMWVYNNPYLSASMYDLAERRSADRRRDAKRATYTKFLEFLQGMPVKTLVVASPNEVAEARLTFPLFDAAMEKVDAKYLEAARRSKKFNGKLVHEWTSLEGKELGLFMQDLREHLTDEMLDEMPADKVRSFVLNLMFMRYVLN